MCLVVYVVVTPQCKCVSVMDILSLSRIDEELDSFEVAALCFLCQDVLNRKRLESVSMNPIRVLVYYTMQ